MNIKEEKIFYLPVSWEESGIVPVRANSLEEAVANFQKNIDSIKLPDKHEYTEGSFTLSSDDMDYMEDFQETMRRRNEILCNAAASYMEAHYWGNRVDGGKYDFSTTGKSKLSICDKVVNAVDYNYGNLSNIERDVVAAFVSASII